MRRPLVLAALSLFLAAHAGAVTLEGPADVASLTMAADAVVRGQVVKQTSDWAGGDPASGLIVTTVELKVIESWKGQGASAAATVRVQVPVTELEAPLIVKGQPVRVNVEGLPGRPAFESSVTRLAYALDEATRTMLVEADFPNPKHELRPGMYASVKLGVEKHDDVLTVPVNEAPGPPPCDAIFVRLKVAGVDTPKTVAVNSMHAKVSLPRAAMLDLFMLQCQTPRQS